MTHFANETRPPDPAAEALTNAGWPIHAPPLNRTYIGRRYQLTASIWGFVGGYEAQIRRGSALLGKGLDVEPAAALAKATADVRANLTADLAALP